MRDDNRMTTQSFRTADMVRVGMTVDQVSDRVVCQFRNRFRDIDGQILRCVNQHHTAVVNQKHRLDCVIRDHVKAASQILHAIALRRVDWWSL